MLGLAVLTVRRAHALWLAIKALRCSMQDAMRLPLCFIATAVDSPEDDMRFQNPLFVYLRAYA